jgi:hypothetical protein
VTGPGRPGGLGIGDRVRFGGRDQVVIGVSGTAVRLAGTGGEVATVSVSGLLAAEDFAVLDARPRPGMPPVSVLDGLPGEAVDKALWWQRHIVEMLTGVPPDAEEGTVPRPEYDPAVFTITRREQAKAAELTACGHPVTARAIAWRRRRYQEQGLAGMVDRRAGRRMPPHGRSDAAVVAAMRQAIGEAADESTRTAAFVFRRARQILAEERGDEAGRLPSERTLYRLFGRLEAGRHTTESARTRRSLAARPEGPFGRVTAAAPGDVMQIDSTPLDVLVRLDDGVTGRVDLTGIIDATRTVTAAVDVDDVDDDVNGDAAAGGLGADQVQLVLGSVDQDDPGPQVLRVAGLGLVERGGDHLAGVAPHGPGQPLAPGLRPGPELAGAVPAAGRGDHVVRAAFRRVGVVDGDQAAILLRFGFSPDTSRVRILPRRAAAFAVAARSAPGRITMPLQSADMISSVRDVHGSGIRAT